MECAYLKFEQQSLLCLVQDQRKQSQGAQANADPTLIITCIAIERNENGQIYVVQGLERSLHFSVPTSSIRNFVVPLYPPLKESTDNKNREIKGIYVPNTTNYISPEVAVINAKNRSSSPTDCPVQKCNTIMTNMFVAGLANVFKYQEKKRSGTLSSKNNTDTDVDDETSSDVHDFVSGVCSVSIQDVHKLVDTNKSHSSGSYQSCSSKSSRKKRRQRNKKRKSNNIQSPTISARKESALPTITLGWTQNDAHRYKDNKSTIFGNIKPFLRDGGLDGEMKRNLLDIIEVALTSIPDETMCFELNDSSNSKDFIEARMNMINEFYHLLGGKGKCNFKAFRVEGITIIIPLGIGPHRDILNCFLKGMSSVLQINGRIPMNEETIPGGRNSVMWKWLELNGYSTWFPCSIILYSRKCVSLYCQKEADMAVFAAKSTLHRSVCWAIMNRVGSQVDYLSYVWNNDQFIDIFMKVATKRKSSHFNGLFMVNTAAYDKTVSSLF